MDKLLQFQQLYGIYCEYEKISHLLPRPSANKRQQPITPIQSTPQPVPSISINTKTRRKGYQPRSKRKVWVSDRYKSRDIDGFYAKNFLFYKEHDLEEFFQLTNMSPTQFDHLLGIVKMDLSKKSIRVAIPPACRLALLLTYLATGTDLDTLSEMFKMAVSSVRCVLLETSQVVWNNLSKSYGLEPSAEQYTVIEREFWAKYKVPNCIGSIDARTLNSEWPEKKKKDIDPPLLMTTVCDSKFIFLLVDVGIYNYIQYTFEETELLKRIKSDELPYPPPINLPDEKHPSPHFFVGNANIPLHTRIIAPYDEGPSALQPDEEDFNSKIAPIGSLNENAMALLVSRWRFFQSKASFRPESTAHLAKAAVVLHNYVLLSGDGNNEWYNSASFVDRQDVAGNLIEGSWRNELQLDEHMRAVYVEAVGIKVEDILFRDKLKMCMQTF